MPLGTYIADSDLKLILLLPLRVSWCFTCVLVSVRVSDMLERE